MADYSHNLIKTYKHWEIYVFDNQSYLGRCIVWCKREDATDLADASLEEQQELFEVLAQLREASSKVFNPSWFNYAFLGNETPHLHGHFIPRYKQSVEFEGMTFTDERFGHNYLTDYSFETPRHVVERVRDLYKEAALG